MTAIPPTPGRVHQRLIRRRMTDAVEEIEEPRTSFAPSCI
jgi:hypothetical protein